MFLRIKMQKGEKKVVNDINYVIGCWIFSFIIIFLI